MVCLNLQQLISRCNSPPSGGRCSAGGHGLPVQDGRGKEGLCLCLLLPCPVCSPASYLGCLCRGTWQSRAPSSPAHCGREIFVVLTLKYINGALQGAVFTFVCRKDFFLVPGFSRWLCDQEFCSYWKMGKWKKNQGVKSALPK